MKMIMNKKALFVSVSIVLVVILIAVTSFVNAGLDPNYWTSIKFISDMAITIALVFIGVAGGYAEGDNYFRTNPNGLFVASYNSYNTERKKIDKLIDKFDDWLSDLYKKEYYKKCMRFLIDENGIKQAELIILLDRSEIVQLLEPKCFKIDGKDRYFNSLTQEQIDKVLMVIDGQIKVKYVQDCYFLNAYSKNSNKSMYEQAGEQEKRKRQKFIIYTGFRVLTTIGIGMIFTALIIDKANGVDTSQALITLLSRYFTLFSSLAWGIIVSNDLIKEESMFLDYKSQIIEQFYLDVEINKTFIAKTEEQKAFEKLTKKLEEEKDGGRKENGTRTSAARTTSRTKAKGNIHS